MLTPNATYTANGVTVKEKIIPDGTTWKDSVKAANAGFKRGSLYKRQQKLSNGTGKVKKVTVHTTDDLPNVNDDAEQYTRATYNENMGSARVHFYVDDLGAWQNLKAGTGETAADPVGSAEIGWHAGDGSTVGGGNECSIGVEIVMNDTQEHDAKACDNGARLCAWLLYRNGLEIDDLVTHSFWNAKAAGKTNADVDKQCVNYVTGKHWCPYYIFDSKSESGALTNWKKFKRLVEGYLNDLKKPAAVQPQAPHHPFEDVPADAWYAPYVQAAWEEGLVNGTDATHFSPDEPLTRAQGATLMVRLLGKLLDKLGK